MGMKKQDRSFTRTAYALERKLGVKKSFAQTNEKIDDTRNHVDEVVKKLLLDMVSEVDKLEKALEDYVKTSDYDAYKLIVAKSLDEITAKCSMIEASIGSVGEANVLTLTSDFIPYDGGAEPWCVKNTAGVVELHGEVSPANAENSLGSKSTTVICTLPDGFRPHTVINRLCQGEGPGLWLLTVATDGTVSASRYRSGSEYVTPAATAWMPFEATFIAKTTEEGE